MLHSSSACAAHLRFHEHENFVVRDLKCVANPEHSLKGIALNCNQNYDLFPQAKLIDNMI